MALTDRLDRLEAENKSLRRQVRAVVVGVVALLTIGAMQKKAQDLDDLRAARIVAKSISVGRIDTTGGLTLRDERGNVLASLRPDNKGRGRMDLFGAHGLLSIEFGEDGTPVLAIQGEENGQLHELKLHNVGWTAVRNGVDRAYFTSLLKGTTGTMLRFLDERGAQRAHLGQNEKHGAVIRGFK